MKITESLTVENGAIWSPGDPLIPHVEALMRRINRFLAIIFTLIIVIYLGSVTASAGQKQIDEISQNPRIELSKKEQAFLSDHPVIRLGIDGTWAPYVMTDANGKLQGFEVDTLRYINEITGANIQLVAGQWVDIVKKAKAHKIDGLTVSAPLKARAPYFNFSDVYASDFPLVIIPSGNPLKISQLGDLAGKTLAVQKGNEFYESLLKPHPDIKVIPAESEIESIAMIVNGKVDAALSSTSIYHILIKKFVKTIKIEHVIINRPLDLVYSIRKDWPELIPIINKALEAIPQETKNNNFLRWFAYDPVKFRAGNEEVHVPLTVQEKMWIKRHPEIRLGVDPTWQPVDFIDKKGRHQGIASDYVRILNRRLGLKMKMVSDLSWVQVMAAVAQKGVDVLPGVAKTTEREKYLIFSDPYIHIDWVIISRMGTPVNNSLADLEGRITAVDEGYSSQYLIEQQYPGIPLIKKNTTLNVLQSVIEGKAEAAVVERNVATMIIQGHRIHSLKIDQHIFQNIDAISFAVRNDWPELVQILNKGLASIPMEERDRIKSKWLAMPIQIGFTKTDVLRIVLSVIAGMSILLVFFWFWNHRLKKEISERIKVEQALEYSNSLLRIREEQIKISLREKETLLQEIHHRVKNNMNVVSSLLKLQANNTNDDRIKDILKDSQNRIFAMSAIHEALHGSENLSAIDLKNHLTRIATSIFQSSSVNFDKVNLVNDIETIPIGINQASPLGLIINELISNSLKYAFPGDKMGKIKVALHKKNVKELELTVADDGVGMPDELEWRNSNTLGLKLVRTLVENQLDGSIDLDTKNGTKFIIKFNIE